MENQSVIAALTAEGNDLDAIVADLSPAQWQLATPAEGWTIAHQIAHLAATFRLAALAVSNPDAFKAMSATMSPDFNANVTAAMADFLRDPPDVLLHKWREQRANAESVIAAAPGGQPVPWLVRPLLPAILAAAGLMETFAHGQDVADALGVRRTPTNRMRYLVDFAVRTWDFGYQSRGLTPPEVEFRFELTGPSGDLWAFGPEEGTQRISGLAADFCLLVTRRRHRDDLMLTASGADAERWLDLAQAYRGPAGSGRAPGQFSR